MNKRKRITAPVNHLIRQLVPPPRRLIPGKGSYVPTGKTGMEASPEYSAIAERMLDKRICRGTALKHRHVEGLEAEKYRLEITPDGIVIESGGIPGWRWGLATLRQIRAICGDSLPCLTIEDAPVFSKRGVMLDVTRGRVWTMRHLKETIRQLALWKYNVLQLYFECAFATPGHEKIWKNMSPVTPEELSELDRYAAEYGIELSICQNCFGHLTRFLIHPDYRHLAEIQPGMVYEAWGSASAVPQSVSPENPQSSAFVLGILEHQFPACRSPYFNIGCDETVDLGYGCSQQSVRAKGIERVFATYVNTLCDAVRKAGKRPMIWADFPLNHPETFSMLTDDLTLLLWGYEADTPFDAWCRNAQAAGYRDYWVCPGSNAWSSFFGRFSRRRSNLRRASEAGGAEGASGYLLTDWGDGGHRQCWGPSLMAFAEGGCFAWGGVETVDSAAVGQAAFGSSAAGLWYEKAGCLEEIPAAKKLPSLYADLHIPWHSMKKNLSLDEITMYRNLIQELDQLKKEVPDDVPELLRREMIFSVDFALFAARRAVLRREGRLVELKELAPELNGLIREFKFLWRKRSRPGGLKESAAKWRNIQKELETIF